MNEETSNILAAVVFWLIISSPMLIAIIWSHLKKQKRGRR